MELSLWLVLLGSWIGIAGLMAILWHLQRTTKNAGIVDVAWSFGTGLVGVAFCLFGTGDPTRRILLGAMIGFWGFRLGLHLWQRMKREPEDGRYTAIREKTGAGADRWLFIFFQVQAVWALMFASPLLIAARNTTPGWQWTDTLGVAIWIFAIGGESLSDRQLARFKARPDSKGQVCRDGLWGWSRHPNYFFEWLHWFAYVAIGWNAAYGWATLAGPAVMLFFLFKITGIPPTEKQALRSRGEAYRQYQREVSPFFPWPPKRDTALPASPPPAE